MNYNTKDRRHSSQSREVDPRTVSQGSATSCTTCTGSKHKHLKGQEKAALFLLFPSGFEDPKPDSCGTEPWVGDRET